MPSTTIQFVHNDRIGTEYSSQGLLERDSWFRKEGTKEHINMTDWTSPIIASSVAHGLKRKLNTVAYEFRILFLVLLVSPRRGK